MNGTPQISLERFKLAGAALRRSATPTATVEPPPVAPGHLRPETAAWWQAMVSERRLGENDRRLLQLAGEAWDRCQQARAAIAEHGATFDDRLGNPRARPEVAIERDSRLAFAKLIQQLGLPSGTPANDVSNRISAGVSTRRRDA